MVAEVVRPRLCQFAGAATSRLDRHLGAVHFGSTGVAAHDVLGFHRFAFIWNLSRPDNDVKA